jgi:hypothetical protein
MLVLFGGSFVCEPYDTNPELHPVADIVSDNIEDYDSDHLSWFKMLSDDLGTEYKTYGKPGISFEHSMLEFFEYLTSADYDSNDQIVFTLTASDRSPVISKEFRPEWAYLASYKIHPEQLNSTSRQLTGKLTSADEHYKRFNQFYKDWFLLKNQDLIVAQRYFLLQTLHSLPNKTVSISVGIAESSIAKFFPKHAKFNLGEISIEEICAGDLQDIVRKNAGRYDHRLNHLHEINHHVLKDIVYAGLTDDNFSNFNSKSFHKNIVSLK